MAFFTESWKIDLFSCLIFIISSIYLFLRWNYSHWYRQGFKTLSGYSYFVGHLKSNIPPKKTISVALSDMYNATDEPFIGIYALFRPMLLVRDPKVIQSILIKDFSHFTDRIVRDIQNDYDPIQSHLFTLPGSKWKPLRTKLTPAFTSGKLKAMFSTIVECGSKLQTYLDKLADEKKLLDVREISASHTTNIISSVAFGIEIDAIGNPNNDFRKHGRNIFQPNLKTVLAFVAPQILRIFRIKVLSSEVENFIMSIVEQNLHYREKNNVVRKDIFQLLIQLRNTGAVQLDDEWETVIKADDEKKMSMIEIAAELFIFFFAGFETSSTTLTFCLYELAKNPEIQQHLQTEIDRILQKFNGQITYESISEMKYLNACIDETLRKYPVLGVLTRACVKDYQIPGTDNIIRKGTEIFIPAMALQWDENYYEEPAKFNPYRFSEENSAGKNILTRPYLPFGEGPRNCIGLRLGKIQTKVGLVVMLNKFKFALNDKQKNRELQFDPRSFLLAPLEPIHLHVFKR